MTTTIAAPKKNIMTAAEFLKLDRETLREYILVSQNKRQIEQWILNEKGKWQFEAIISSGILPLVCLPFELDIEDVYLNIQFLQTEHTPQ